MITVAPCLSNQNNVTIIYSALIGPLELCIKLVFETDVAPLNTYSILNTPTSAKV
jgi:hypothetical protein